MKDQPVIEHSAARAPVRLISLDFDGTILVYDDPAGVFHSDVIDLLNSLEALGISWCANSGRNMEDQIGVLDRSRARGLRYMPDALICSESVVFVREKGSYVPLEPWNSMAHADLRECHARVQECLDGHLGYIQKVYQPESTMIGDLFTAFLVHDRNAQPVRLFHDLTKFLSGLEGLMITRNGGWVAVMHEALGKGHALKAFARHRNLTSDQILAIGDQYNDLPMLILDVAHHVGCPGDAIPEVRQAVRKADGVVADAAGPLGTIEVIKTMLHRSAVVR